MPVTLAARLRDQGQLPVPEACRIVAAIARSVATLHAAGDAHGAISPRAVALDDDACPVLLPPQRPREGSPAPTDDIYALGATLFECLTGAPPSSEGWLTLPLDLEVPRFLGDVLVHTLHPEPGRRFASALELAGALEPSAVAVEAVSPTPIRAGRRWRHVPLVLATALLTGLALISVAFGMEREDGDTPGVVTGAPTVAAGD